MGRRRKNHGDSRLASDQILTQNQNNICLRPCHSLQYHHQALRNDTRADYTPSFPQMQAMAPSMRETESLANRPLWPIAGAVKTGRWNASY